MKRAIFLIALALGGCGGRVHTAEELKADPALLAQTQNRCFGNEASEQCRIVGKVLWEKEMARRAEAKRQSEEVRRRLFGSH